MTTRSVSHVNVTAMGVDISMLLNSPKLSYTELLLSVMTKK